MAQSQLLTSLPSSSVPLSLRGLKDVPILRQVLLLVAIAAAVAGGIAVFKWSQEAPQVALFPEMGGQDAAAALEALRTAGIQAQVDAVNGTLMVAAEKAHEARLLLASKGLPKATASGFEMMQQDPGLGVSSFLEGARYNHALETELARSVGLLAPVKAARVHLAIPKPSAFARPGDGASASVLVELYPGRTLEANQVQAIVHMVGSSVANLSPQRVTVVDQFGRLLSGKNNDALAVSAEQFDHVRRVESDYVRRIETLLAPITGPGKVSTQVSAELDFSVTEEARESYAPDKAAMRSEQTAEQSTSAPAGPAQGVPGATSNQPPEAQPQQPLNQLAGTPAAGAPLNSSKTAVRSFEVDRTLSHTRQPVGRLKRLSIAVLVDNLPRSDAQGTVSLQPLSAEDLQKIEALVKDAVGFDAARGDRVSVQNLGFLPAAPVEAPEALPLWKQPQVQTLMRHGFGLLAVIVLVFAALRPALRNLLAPPPPAPMLPQVAGVLVGPDGAEPEAAGANARTPRRAVAVEEDEALPGDALGPYERKLQSARSAVSQDPKRVAQVVKSWLAEDAGN